MKWEDAEEWRWRYGVERDDRLKAEPELETERHNFQVERLDLQSKLATANRRLEWYKAEMGYWRDLAERRQ